MAIGFPTDRGFCRHGDWATDYLMAGSMYKPF